MNEVNLMGRLVKDPELRYSQTGKPWATFNLAVQRSYKNADGEYEADFIRCKAFGKRAETIVDYIEKGNRIIVNGNIQTDSYEKDGQRVFVTDVAVNNFEFIDSKKTKSNAQTQREEPTYKDEPESISIDDDDLPF